MLDITRWSLRATALAFALLAALLAHAQKGSTPLLFEVRSATNTVYLLGTVHVGSRQMYPMSSAVEEAFARSRVLALEIDPNDREAALAALQGSLYRPPDNLRNHISPELLAELQEVLPRIGLPIEYAQTMKPPLLAITLAMMEIARLGYDPAMGVESHLAARAKERGMPLVQLESAEEQMRLFDLLSEPTQAAVLAQALHSIARDEMAGELDELLAAWSQGDAKRLLEVIERENADLPTGMGEELREALYTRRNRGMAAKVEAMLAGEVPHFVAVGAGHLLGEDGVVALLRARGFTVKQL
jgi:uncharacterized protein YbaP (TraB family)